MNRKVFKLFQITKGFLQNYKNQQIRFHYSKLEHFFENYEQSEFEQIKISQNILETILYDMNQQNSYHFNISLTTFLKIQKITLIDLLNLLQGLYQNNTFISKFNKQILNQYIIKELKELNEQTIQLLTISGLIGLGEDELTEECIYQFLRTNFQQLTFYQKISLIFIFGQLSLRHNVLEQNYEFMQKWQQLLQTCQYDINLFEDQFEGNSLSQIAFLIKGIVQNDQDLIVQINKKIKDDVKFIFSLLMEKCQKNINYKYMTIKELTVLLISVTKIKHQFTNIKFDILIKSLLDHIKFIGLNDCSEVALQALVYSLTQLPYLQKFLQDEILKHISQRLQNKDFTSKMMMIIIYEIFFKWQLQISKTQLENLLIQFDLKEFSDQDICNYFELLSILPRDKLLNILDKKEEDLFYRQKNITEIQESNRKDANIFDRQRRAFLKMSQQFYQNSQENQTLARISKLFF